MRNYVSRICDSDLVNGMIGLARFAIHISSQEHLSFHATNFLELVRSTVRRFIPIDPALPFDLGKALEAIAQADSSTQRSWAASLRRFRVGAYYNDRWDEVIDVVDGIGRCSEHIFAEDTRMLLGAQRVFQPREEGPDEWLDIGFIIARLGEVEIRTAMHS